MAKNVTRTLMYLVADSVPAHTNTLQQDIEAILDQLKTVDDRVVQDGERVLTGTTLQKEGNMLLLQFAASVPGEKASTLPLKIRGKESVALDTAEPPKDHDFSDGDIICLIEGDNIYACFSGLREEAIYSFLKGLFDKTSKDVKADDWLLDILRGAPKDTVRHIEKYGIKSLEIHTVANASTASAYTADKKGNVLQRLFAKDSKLHKAVEDSSARVSLTFSRSRFRGGDFKWLINEARRAVRSGDEYVIVTMDGREFKPNNMVIKHRCKFTPYGKSVFLSEAVTALKDFRLYVKSN